MRTTKLLLAGLMLLTVFQAQAKSRRFDRTISIDSGYYPGFSSIRSFWNFGIEFDYAGSKVFDWVDNTRVGEHPLGRFILGAVAHFGWSYPQYSFFVANHEFGHGTRAISAGGAARYIWNGSSLESRNIFLFFGDGLFRHGQGAATLYRDVDGPWNWSGVIAAAGMNNSMSYAEALEDEVSQQGGHIFQYVGYVRAKEDASVYVDSVRQLNDPDASSDIRAVRESYANLGYNISDSHMKLGSQLSRWLSATHWAYLWSATQYVWKGDPTVRPFSYAGFKAPDLSHFFTPKGLSYKLRSEYRDGADVFPFSLEYVYEGKKEVEVGLGMNRFFRLSPGRKGRYGGNAYVNFNCSIGFNLHGDFPLSKIFVASAGASLYQTKTLIGSRQLGVLLNNSLGYELWGRISALY